MSLDNIVAVLSANVANGCSIPELCKDFKEIFGLDLLVLCKDAGFQTVSSYLKSRPREFQVSKGDRWSLIPGAFPQLKENEDRILRSTKGAGKSRGGKGPPPRGGPIRSRGFGGAQSKHGAAFGTARDNYDNGGRVSPKTTTRLGEFGDGSSSRSDRNNDYYDYPSSYNLNPSRNRGGYDDDDYDRLSDTRDYNDQRSYSKDNHDDYDDVGGRADRNGVKEDYRDRNSYKDYDRNRDSGYDRNRDGKWQAEEHSRSSYYSARDGDRYNGYSDARDYDDRHSQHSGRSDRAERWKEDEYGQARSNKDGRGDSRDGDYRFNTLSDRDRSKNFGYVNAADARLSSRDDKDRKEKEKAEKELWNIFHPGEEMSSGTKAGREKENSRDDRAAAAGPSTASTLPVAEASIKSSPASVRSSQPSEAALDLYQAPTERMTGMSLADEKLGKELTAIEAQDAEARQSMLSNSHVKVFCTEMADAFVSCNRKFLSIEEALELTYFMVEEICKTFEIEYTGKQFTRMLRKMCILHLAIYFPNYFLYNPYKKTLMISNAGLRDLPSNPEKAARLSPHPNDKHLEQFFTNLPPGLTISRTAVVPPPPGLVQGLSPPPGLSRSRAPDTNSSKPPGLPFGKLKFSK
ncbi:hypothetical protein WR25_01565 [Diploscapter pachys]|uniref:Uncharacterized protein n=1 Tax=Diploscapter pachys TaxID=2018661 RepID=A0A2A2K5P4_9BILA|nr:hypothetical protein WR25_01565 [Diploscapter pachys]